MGRHPRIEGQSLVYYVSSRGRRGQKIFKDDKDKVYFLNLLKQQRIKSKLTFYGYVLLPELYALLMETHKNNFVQSMHRINSCYANYSIRRYHNKNKLFHDRYKAFIIDKQRYLTEASRYLHLLPIKAGITKSPIHYEWSSFPGYIYKKKRENWVDYNTILRMFNTKIQQAALDYQKYADEGLKEQISSPFKDLKETIVLGSEDFRKKIYENHRSNEIALQKEELSLAKKIIEVVNQDSYWPSLRTKGRRISRSSLVRNAAIYFIKNYTDLSNLQISHFFQSLEKSSISQMSRRFNQTKEKSPSLKKISMILESEIRAIVLKEK